MILIIVEDKTDSIERMQQEESSLNRQLERYATITSQLLSGTKVDSLCGEITRAITEVSNFENRGNRTGQWRQWITCCRIQRAHRGRIRRIRSEGQALDDRTYQGLLSAGTACGSELLFDERLRCR